MSELLYAERADLYDLIYGFKRYAAEAEGLVTLLREEGVADGSRVLEAACGTGSYLAHLREVYVVEGFDLAPEMLAIAKRKVPGVPVWLADLADFSVDQPVDAVCCLFSSIAYLFPEERLRRAARCCAAAVRPGGVVVVEPFLDAADYDVGRPHLQVGRGDDVEVARATVAGRKGDLAVLDMHYLVARRDQPVEHFAETHRLWMVPRRTLLSAFEDAGFDVRFLEEGAGALARDRGLLVGRRRG